MRSVAGERVPRWATWFIQRFQDKIGLRPADATKDHGKGDVLGILRDNLFTCATYLGRSERDKVLRLPSTDP